MTHPLTIWCQTFATVLLTVGFLEYHLDFVIGGAFMLMLASVFAAGE